MKIVMREEAKTVFDRISSLRPQDKPYQRASNPEENIS